MATTKTNSATFDDALEQLKDAGEQFAAAARKAGNLYLDSYEQTVDRAIDLEQRVAGLSKHEWLKDVIEAQADIARELAGSYTAAARSLLK
jgi:hypothetical protein